MLYPQDFYISKIVIKLCGAYNAESMHWGNYFDYKNLRTFYETSGAKDYINLYLYAFALVVGIIVHTVAYWPDIQHEDESKKDEQGFDSELLSEEKDKDKE
jgi:hypothetical protein